MDEETGMECIGTWISLGVCDLISQTISSMFSVLNITEDVDRACLTLTQETDELRALAMRTRAISISDEEASAVKRRLEDELDKMIELMDPLHKRGKRSAASNIAAWINDLYGVKFYDEHEERQLRSEDIFTWADHHLKHLGTNTRLEVICSLFNYHDEYQEPEDDVNRQGREIWKLTQSLRGYLASLWESSSHSKQRAWLLDESAHRHEPMVRAKHLMHVSLKPIEMPPALTGLRSREDKLTSHIKTAHKTQAMIVGKTPKLFCWVGNWNHPQAPMQKECNAAITRWCFFIDGLDENLDAYGADAISREPQLITWVATSPGSVLSRADAAEAPSSTRDLHRKHCLFQLLLMEELPTTAEYRLLCESSELGSAYYLMFETIDVSTKFPNRLPNGRFISSDILLLGACIGYCGITTTLYRRRSEDKYKDVFVAAGIFSGLGAGVVLRASWNETVLTILWWTVLLSLLLSECSHRCLRWWKARNDDNETCRDCEAYGESVGDEKEGLLE